MQVEGFTGDDQAIISKWGSYSSTAEYLLELSSTTNKLAFMVYDGSVQTTVTANTFGALSTGEWYFVYVYHDEHNDEIGISINDGAVDTATHTGGVNNSTTDFNIGRRAGSSHIHFYDGLVDEVGVWDRVLTEEELDYLYNDGDGQAYPFQVPPISAQEPQPTWITHEYDYDENHPHAVAEVVRNQGELGQYTDTFTYDANGNMTCRIEDGQTWRQTYNAQNRLAKIELMAGDCATGTPGDTWNFYYDGNGNRVRQVNPDSTVTLFLGGGIYTVEDASGTPAVNKYYALAGQKVAMYADSATSFLITDHLGSVVAVTDASGALVANSQQRYLPFGGELLGADSPTDFGYTGQRNI
jgi:YD repeat-containing protein